MSTVTVNNTTRRVTVTRAGSQGAIGLNWRGDWATATVYALNDGVYNDGTSYRAIAAHTAGAANEPGVGADWEDFWVVLALGSDVDSVAAVAAIAAQIVTVAGVADEIATLAPYAVAIGTVAMNIAEVVAVAGISAAVVTVAENIADILAVEDLAAETATARDVTAAVMTTVLDPQFATLAAAQAFAPTAAPDYIRTAGLATAGDGKGALYKKVGSQPSHADKFSITLSDAVTVVWFELVGAIANPTGSNASPNLLFGQNYNLMKSGVAASIVLGGTTTQPNAVGKQVHRQTFAGDGTTTAFVVSAPFTINDLARINIRVNVKTTAGGLLNYSEGSGFSISGGYGTSAITVAMDSPPAAGTVVEATVIGEADESAADATLVFMTGYDNVCNAVMSLTLGSHGIVFDGSGHNSILGGSYSRIDGSYNTVVGGKTQWIGLNDGNTFGCWSCGNGNVVDGSTAGAFGDNNAIRGIAAIGFGRDHSVPTINDVIVSGRRGRAYMQGERIHAGGRGTDTDPGLYQLRELVLSGNTTDATTTGLANTGANLTQAMPTKSAALLRVEVAGMKDDYAKAASFAGDFLLTVDAGGTSRVNGSTSDVAVTLVNDYGSSGYLAYARAISGGLQVRVKGAAGENVRWAATARLTQVRYT